MRKLLHRLLTFVCVWALLCALPLEVRADPVSGIIAAISIKALLTSLAVSAAVSAGMYGLQRLLMKRPKPFQQGQRSDSVYIQDSQWGTFINEVYGARVGGLGGVKIAGNVIDASTIRKTVTTSTVESGGKGAPKQQVENTAYYQDLDICYGRGPLRFLKIFEVGFSGQKLLYDATALSGPTGVVDETFPSQGAQDNILLPNPQTADTFPAGRYGETPVADAEGVIEVILLNNTVARLYPGNEIQLPDPLFESVHGVGSTPAYRGRAHIVFENVDVSQGHPTYHVVVENMEHTSLSEIIATRAIRTNVLTATDLSLTALASTEVRGYLVSQVQAPRADAEILGRVFNADFYEGPNGKINGVALDETITMTLDADYVGAVSGDAPQDYSTAQGRQRDELDLPFRLEFSAADPENNHEPATRHASRGLAAGRKSEPTELPVTLTRIELQRLANRELQLAWREASSLTFTTTHTYRDLLPSQRIRVPFGGADRTVRIKERRGTVPGLLTFTCAGAEGLVLDTVGTEPAAPDAVTPAVPANTVVTLIDVPRLWSPQDTPGLLWADAPRDAASGEWTASSLWVNKGGGYQHVDTSEGPSTMGRVVTSALPDVPGGWTEGSWDTVSTVTIDLFYGTPQTKTDAQVLEGENMWVIGSEVVGIATWSAVGGHPNRWTGSRMQRKLRDTLSTGHVVGERAVLMNSAVRFVKVDTSEQGVARTYRAATVAPAASQPVTDAAPVSFTWTGLSIAGTETLTIVHVTDQITFDDAASRDATRANLRVAEETLAWL